MARIPFVVVGGFLGAGKTTLLNRILAGGAGGRIAVIVNEFGEMGLDHDLIIGTVEDMVLLASGCLCCTLRGDLITALTDLLAKRAAGQLTFDRLVVETTGLADPAPVLHTLMVEPGLAQTIRLDGVVTVCDAALGAAGLDRVPEALAQVAMADVLVISKADRVTPLALGAFQARLARLAPLARQNVAGPQMDLAALFGHGVPDAAIGAKDWLLSAPALPLRPFAAAPETGLLGAAFAPPLPRHDGTVTAVSARIDTPIHPMMLEFFLETLLALRGPDILRMKALLWVQGHDAPFALHAVQHIVDPPIRLEGWRGTDRTSRIVVIGRNMTEDDLQAALGLLRAPA